ncbi:MAG: winged helix-turn-helix domain-containing protein [Anaerolineae bacterium]
MILLREYMGRLPATLLIDHNGDNINYPIKAMQLGVAEYLLASEPDIQRELSVRLLVERSRSIPKPTPPLVVREQIAPAETSLPFEWDPVRYVISCDGQRIQLSPAEGRLFNLLMANRGRTVGVRDLMRYALRKPDVEFNLGVRQLRPHMMRLRRKLNATKKISLRIVSTRGMGYMLV